MEIFDEVVVDNSFNLIAASGTKDPKLYSTPFQYISTFPTPTYGSKLKLVSKVDGCDSSNFLKLANGRDYIKFTSGFFEPIYFGQSVGFINLQESMLPLNICFGS